MIYYPFVTDCKIDDYIIVDFCGALQLHKINKTSSKTIRIGCLIFSRRNGMPYNGFTRRFSAGIRKATEKDIMYYTSGVKIR